MLRVGIVLVFLAIVQAQTKAKHCQRDQVKHDCIKGRGMTVYNTGSGIFWNPNNEETFERNNGLKCIPCCPYNGTTLPLCKPQRETQNPRRRKEIQQQHCLRSKVRTTCQAGPGKRIRNSGPSKVWDPAFEEDLGVEPGFNCIHCCSEDRKTLQACNVPVLNQNKNQQYDGERQRGEEMETNVQYRNGWNVEENVQYQDGWKVDQYKI